MSLQSVFYPRSVAVVGASAKAGSIGCDILKNISHGFEGEIYPVNNKYGEIFGEKCYNSLKDLPKVVDLVIVIIPAKFVPDLFTEIADFGCRAVVVISAGFRESGEDGLELENKIRKICMEQKITLIGVNCLGIMNVQTGLNASFATDLPAKGNIAFVAQSGALCTAVIDYSYKMGLGFSKIISIGNKTVIDELALLEYLDNDSDTRVIMMYIEDIVNPTELLETAKRLKKPVVVLKSGRTESGKRAIFSHTGALGGSDIIYSSLFRQVGMLRVDNIEDLFNVSLAFASNPLPKGPNVAIITNAGGPGGITSDAVEINDLKLAKLSQKTTENLKNNLPPACGISNPVDLLGDSGADRYEFAIDCVLSDENVDSIIIILTPQSVTEVEKTAEVIVSAKNKYKKPIFVSFMGDKQISVGREILVKNQVCSIPYPDLAVKSLACLYKFSQNKNLNLISKSSDEIISKNKKQQATKLFNQIKTENLKNLPQSFIKKIFEIYELPIVASKIAKTSQEARKVALEINKNLVLKIDSPDISHKSDVGGVILDVLPDEIEQKFEELLQNVKKNAPKAKINGVLIMEKIDLSSGFEFILGVKDEGNLGKSIMFGLGGVLVEVLNDVTFSVAPLDRVEAKKMIRRIKSAKILDGVRGRSELDTESLIFCLLNLSQLVMDFPEIAELDINPLLVLPTGQGCKILDSRILLK